MLGAVETFLSAVPHAGIFTGNYYGMVYAFTFHRLFQDQYIIVLLDIYAS